MRYDRAMEAVMKQHIVMTPGVVGGKPRIDGTRIRVHDVSLWYIDWGWPVWKILEEFPQLTAAQVHAALAFYHDNRELIAQVIRDEDKVAEEFKRDFPGRVIELPRD
jgi:uncharacterized protein (DUF433 family)